MAVSAVAMVVVADTAGEPGTNVGKPFASSLNHRLAQRRSKTNSREGRVSHHPHSPLFPSFPPAPSQRFGVTRWAAQARARRAVTLSQDVRIDITGFWALGGETGAALVVNVCHSFGPDISMPGFHPETEGMYEFKIDLNGDAVEDITYRVTFSERDPSDGQDFELRRIEGMTATDVFAVGTPVLKGHTGTSAQGTAGAHMWCGKAWESGQSSSGASLCSFVLELPDIALTPRAADDRIGVWAVTWLATDAGGWRASDRAGLPMIHPSARPVQRTAWRHKHRGAPRRRRRLRRFRLPTATQLRPSRLLREVFGRFGASGGGALLGGQQ
jgi:hypothetical protein